MQRFLTAFILLLCIVSASAQTSKGQYRARLSTVPIDVAMQNTIAGFGSVTGVLAGDTLTLTGSFEGLKSPATVVRIHRGAKGIRGPAILDLKATAGTSGTITGVVTLTPRQIEELSAGRFYIQLHSDEAPEGNLWGWLLPQETRR